MDHLSGKRDQADNEKAKQHFYQLETNSIVSDFKLRLLNTALKLHQMSIPEINECEASTQKAKALTGAEKASIIAHLNPKLDLPAFNKIGTEKDDVKFVRIFLNQRFRERI